MFVSFGGGGDLDGVSVGSGQALVKGVAYPLTSLGDGVRIARFTKGKIYFSLGNPLGSNSAATQYQANFSDPSQPDYSTRWDKVEIDFDRLSGGTANLSAKDFYSLPLQIQSQGGGLASSNLTWRGDAAITFGLLSKMAKYAVRSATRQDAAIVVGSAGFPIPCGISACLAMRILNPASLASPEVFPGFAAYIQFLQTGDPQLKGQPIQTIISGSNGKNASGSGAQSYSLIATVANKAGVLKNGAKYSAGDLVMTGTVNNGQGEEAFSILLASADFNGNAIYGTAPKVQVLDGKDVNGVALRAMKDYLMGMNFGFVGSAVDSPAMPGTPIGSTPSWSWFGNHPTGYAISPLSLAHAFGAAQPGEIHYYNEYLAHISNVGDSQAINDEGRLQSPRAKLADGSTMLISLLPDTATAQPVLAPSLSVIHGARLNPDAVVAPGSLVLLGGNLPVSFETFPSGAGVPMPRNLAGVSVQTSNGGLVPFLSVSPDTALIQIPWELAGGRSDNFTLRGRGIPDTQVTVKLGKYAPGIYMANPQSSTQGLIYDAAGKLLNASNPAQPGSEIVIYCTGLGPVASPPATGSAAETARLYSTTAAAKVSIGSYSVIVKYAGLAPGLVGVYQVNAILPTPSPANASTPVSITIGGVTSNTVTMAVGTKQ